MTTAEHGQEISITLSATDLASLDRIATKYGVSRSVVLHAMFEVADLGDVDEKTWALAGARNTENPGQ